MSTSYRAILARPGVARLIAAQLLARFPSGMLSLTLILHVEQHTHSYTIAGFAVGAFSIGAALLGPVASRWMGRWGVRPVIAGGMVVYAIGTAIIALAPIGSAGYLYILIGLVTGAATPPIQPAVRTIYPKVVEPRQLGSVYSLDASAQELIWVAGPLVAALLTATVGTSGALLAGTSLMLLGGVWLLTTPSVGEARIPATRHRLGHVLRKPPILVTTLLGLLLVASNAAAEAGTVAAFGDGSLSSGTVLAIFSAGSLVGGLALGGRPVGRWSLGVRLAGVAIGTALATLILDVAWMSLALFVAGLGIAPALAGMFAIISSSAKQSETAEAFGWSSTGQVVGGGLGTAIGGIAIDHLGGAAGALWVGAALVALGAVLAVATRWMMPDMRDGVTGPAPDTGTVPVITRQG